MLPASGRQTAASRPQVFDRIALITPLAYNYLSTHADLHGQLAKAEAHNGTLYCGGLELDFFFNRTNRSFLGLKLAYFSGDTARAIFGRDCRNDLLSRAVQREKSYYEQAKSELKELQSANSRRVLFTLLGIKQEGVLTISQTACQALLWKLFNLESHLGVAVELIDKVTVVGSDKLIDESREESGNFWLRVSTGQLNQWAEMGRRAQPFFRDYTACPPSGD